MLWVPLQAGVLCASPGTWAGPLVRAWRGGRVPVGPGGGGAVFTCRWRPSLMSGPPVLHGSWNRIAEHRCRGQSEERGRQRP